MEMESGKWKWKLTEMPAVRDVTAEIPFPLSISTFHFVTASQSFW